MSKETGTRWKFKTNSPKELLVGNPVYDENPYRTCMTKNILEKEIIKIIVNLNKDSLFIYLLHEFYNHFV